MGFLRFAFDTFCFLFLVACFFSPTVRKNLYELVESVFTSIVEFIKL